MKDREEDYQNIVHGRKKMKHKKRCITANVSNCKYDLVRNSIEASGFAILRDESPALMSAYLVWHDSVVPMERFQLLKDYQHINHFPGMGEVCRKDLLARNMAKMKRTCPADFNFTPRTWNMPSEYSLLLNHAKDSLKNNKRAVTYIQKPANGAMGNGIQLYRSPERIQPADHTIVQEYLDKPLLLDGYKFDLRLYVLVTSCDPLRIFLYQDGLVRLSTEKYSVPTESNVKQLYMHLTNYSVNKQSGKFERHSDFDRGSKRSIKSFLDRLKSSGYDTATLWYNITDMIVKTMLVASPHLVHAYRMCRAGQPQASGSVCFEVLGFDIFIDKKLKPWLLEVNRAPSFGGDEKIDRDIKGGVVREALRLINIRASDKRRRLADEKAATQRRLFTPARSRRSSESLSPSSQRKAVLSRRKEELKQKLALARKEAEKEEYEDANLRGYRRIFPCHDRRLKQKYTTLQGTIFKLFHSLSAPYQKPEFQEPKSMEELMELIEQCEAEEGIVSKPLQPLSSMPTISPLSRRKKRHNSDTSSVTSSDESLSEKEMFRSLRRAKTPTTAVRKKEVLERRPRAVKSAKERRSMSLPTRTRTVETKHSPTLPHSVAALLTPRGVTQRRPVAMTSLDRNIERTEQALSALERTRIKFPGRTDKEAVAILDRIYCNWKEHKPILARYWLVKLDSAKRRKVVDIVRGNVTLILGSIWRGHSLERLRLMRLFNRVFNRMLWSHGQGLWGCFTTSSDSWEVIFSKSTDTVSALELNCCRKVVQLCKDCLLVVYQFANEVTGHIKDMPDSSSAPSYSPTRSTFAPRMRLPNRLSSPVQT